MTFVGSPLGRLKPNHRYKLVYEAESQVLERVLKLGVTGNQYVGKSTVCRLFEELGAYRVDSDEIAHEILGIDEKARRRTA